MNAAESSLRVFTKTAMMAAVIFLCTFLFKIPIALTGGYTHLGDCAIFVGVLVLGRRRGAAAAAVGGAMADLLGGFLLWAPPTFLIKGTMAWLMGSIAQRVLPGRTWGWLAGACAGGIFQIAAYTAVKWILISPAAALATIPTVSVQTLAGIVLAAVVVSALRASHILNRLKEM